MQNKFIYIKNIDVSQSISGENNFKKNEEFVFFQTARIPFGFRNSHTAVELRLIGRVKFRIHRR